MIETSKEFTVTVNRQVDVLLETHIHVIFPFATYTWLKDEVNAFSGVKLYQWQHAVVGQGSNAEEAIETATKHYLDQFK